MKAWNITAIVPGQDSTPTKEYFVVAIESSDQAVEALRIRKGLDTATIAVAGEASSQFVDWLGGLKPGQIVSVMVLEPFD